MAKHRYGQGALAEKIASNTGISPKLIKAVMRQIGGSGEELEGTLKDVNRGGADAGWAGFSYTKDTVAFFKRNRAEIVAHLEQQASDFDKGVIEMVKSFRCAADEEEENIARALYGKLTDADDGIANCLAWYALEEVARGLDE